MPTKHQVAINTFDRFERSLKAMDAFNVMLAATLEQGDELSHYAGGIHRLVEMQYCEFADIYDALVEEKQDMSKRIAASEAGKAGHEQRDPSAVKRVRQQLAGADKSEPTAGGEENVA